MMINKLFADLKGKFKGLPPEKQKMMAKAGAVGVVMVVIWAGYNMNHSTNAGKPRVQPTEVRDLADKEAEKLLERSVMADNQQKDIRLQELEKQLQEGGAPGAVNPLTGEPLAGNPQDTPVTGNTPQVPSLPASPAAPPAPKPLASVPMPLPSGTPPLPQGGQNMGGMPMQQPPVAPVPEKREVFGGILMSTNAAPVTAAPAAAAETDADKKKEKNEIYIPPSLMKGVMLTGLRASTVENARGNPTPVVLMVQNLAMLPNRVKANMDGCIMNGEGHGNLADERAHIRITRLTCLSKKGEAVIDTPIKGFITDIDGSIGASGQVVSKMGALLSRTMLAGLFGGLGDGLKAATGNTGIGLLSDTSNNAKFLSGMQPANIGAQAVGNSISSGANELQKFYLELARQTMPVISVNALKVVTIHISEPTTAEIREIKGKKISLKKKANGGVTW